MRLVSLQNEQQQTRDEYSKKDRHGPNNEQFGPQSAD